MSDPVGRLPAEIERLVPPAYVAALEAIAAGEAEDVVAERAGIDTAAIPSLLRLASAKLHDVGVALEADP